jgi:hypothetical protein
MTRDPLTDLLTAADAAAAGPTPIPSPDLAARVRHTLARRKRTRTASLTTLLLATLVATGFFANQRHPASPWIAVSRPPSAKNTAAELTAIRREIAARERIVTDLLARERLNKAEATVVIARELPPDRVVAERAAAAAVWQATRAARQTGRTRDAASAYADVIRYFPDTVSAQQARKHLERIRKEGGA